MRTFYLYRKLIHNNRRDTKHLSHIYMEIINHKYKYQLRSK